MHQCIDTVNYMHVRKQIKMVSNSTVTLVKNNNGKSPLWQYFGLYKGPSGVIQPERLFINCATVNCHIAEIQQI